MNVLEFLLALSFVGIVFSVTTRKPPKFTLDPEILAQIKEQLKSTSEIPQVQKPPKVTNEIGIRSATANQQIVFGEDPVLRNEGRPHQLLSPENRNVETTSSHKCSHPRERFHVSSGKCYPVLGTITTSGPCGDTMIFYAHGDNKIYGDCDCSYDAEIPQVYHKATNKCYSVYTQGYCNKTEWLVFDRKTENPICETRRCQPSVDSETTIIWFNSHCVTYYEWDRSCKRLSHKVLFPAGSVLPACGESPASEQSSLSNIPKLKCKQGSSQDINGKCRDKIKFNFNG